MIFRDFYEYDIELKIRNEQGKAKDLTLNQLMSKHISIGDGSALCSFTELRKAIARQCSNAENIVHSTNDFLDSLHVTINGTEFVLTMPLFPKGNERKQIEIRINKHNIVTRISTKSLPDSIVNYLVAISEWIPDYALIEERIRTEEEKKRIACKIAFDALKKIADETLKDKGYKYTLKNQGYYNTAALHIKAGNCIRMKFEIKLLEDFIESITAILDSLPICTASTADGNGGDNEPDEFLDNDDFTYGLGDGFGSGFGDGLFGNDPTFGDLMHIA